jgi:hypothetical protein
VASKKRIPLARMAPGAARNKRVAQLAANPGTRSKIPDSLLPAQFRAGRANAQRMKTENATLYNPSQILSGSDLRNSVKAAVDLQINPQLGAFDRSIGSLTGQRDTQAARLGQYFDMYNKQTASGAAALTGGAQQLAAQMAQLGQGSQSQLEAIQQGINSRTTADAALRGPGLQDNGPASSALDFAKAQQAGANAGYQTQAAATGSGFAGIAGTIAAVAPMRAADATANLANTFNKQIADMQGRRAEVDAQRGPLTTQTLDKMRQDQFTNLATMKGLGLKEADLQETVRSHKAQETIAADTLGVKAADSVRDARTAREKLLYTQRKDAALLDIKRGVDPITGKKLSKSTSPSAALAQWRLDFAKKHGYLPKTGPPTKGKDGPSLTLNERVGQAQKFAPVLNTVQQKIKTDFPHDRQGAARALLSNNPNVDPLYASVALDVAYDGHVSRANAKKLHDRGVKVKDLNVPSFADWNRSGKTRAGRRAAGKIPVVG